MEKQLQEILDQSKIIEKINRLFIYTDHRDWEGVKNCFANEVLFDMTSMGAEKPETLTPQQIATAWEDGLKGLQAIHHQAGNYIVKISGSEADVFCYGIAIHYLPNPTNKNTRTFVGSYDFHLTKTEQEWKIDKFKFNLKYIEGNKELESFIDKS